ncbi:WD40 repeat-like protein, partial [Linderina pennispora]
MAPRSRLSDITLRANNSQQHSARQITIFDALNAAHRRNKRQRQQQLSADDCENIDGNAHTPNKKPSRRPHLYLKSSTAMDVCPPVHCLESLVSPTTNMFRLYASDDTQAGLDNRMALVDEGGSISIFNTVSHNDDDNGMVPASRWRGHDNAIFDIKWRHGDAQLQQALLGEFRGHSQTVRIASDGLYTYRPVKTIERAHHGVVRATKPHQPKTKRHTGSVTNVQSLAHNPNLIASVGSTNAMVRYWDMRSSYSTRSTLALPVPRPRGASSLTLDPDGTRLYSASNDNTVYVHNALAPGYPVAHLTAPEFICDSFNISTSVSPCGQYLAAGSTNGSVVVWELDRYGFNSSKRRVVLQGHTKEASCVAWYPLQDRTQLVTCGDDSVMRVWDIDAELAEQGRNDPMKRCQWGLASVLISSMSKC